MRHKRRPKHSRAKRWRGIAESLAERLNVQRPDPSAGSQIVYNGVLAYTPIEREPGPVERLIDARVRDGFLELQRMAVSPYLPPPPIEGLK